MKHEGILLHQYTLHDEKGEKFRTIKATKKTRKMLARLAVVAKDQWPEDTPFIVVLEPELTDYGYIPRTALLVRGKTVDEVVPGSKNKYMITSTNPATMATCPQTDLWEDDVENFFEPNVAKGNYVKVSIKYDKNGRMKVRAQVVKEARKKAVEQKKKADKMEEKRVDVVPPKDSKPKPTKKEKEKAREKAKEDPKSAPLKDLLKPKEGKK